MLPRLPSVNLTVELSLVDECAAELLPLVLKFVISRLESEAEHLSVVLALVISAAEQLSDVLAVEPSQLMYAGLGVLSDIIEFICVLLQRITNRTVR